MSMNIMRTFNQLLPVDRRTRTSAGKRLLRYAIYAWCVPILFVTSCAMLASRVPYLQTDTYGQTFLLNSCSAGLVFFFTLNFVMFAQTAWKIRRDNAENAEILNINRERRYAAKRWFTLNVKLFLIMGGHLPVWLFWVIWISPTATHVLAAFEAFQSSLIFYIFIWKHDIKRTLLEQFNTFLTRHQLIRLGMPQRAVSPPASN
ncbi:uncharacterized protein LOC110117162 isoform X2 [Athalia rosae]|uniref:uncharacterized protein LOC110117162 isoform X2 n=1 Tax=Athalia rosae TaxID=37344 RepID=UPI0020346B0C|nr:uncharacterized protein LOC110117162 isoform X2 [Athalia rosae]